MAFRAVLSKQKRSRGNSVRVIRERIAAISRFFGRLLQFRIDGRIVFRGLNNGTLLGISTLCQDYRHRKKGSTNSKGRDNGFHLRPPNSRLTIAANPVISRETPQRIKNRWLLSFKPNPGETRSVHPDGKFHAITGAK